ADQDHAPTEAAADQEARLDDVRDDGHGLGVLQEGWGNALQRQSSKSLDRFGGRLHGLPFPIAGWQGGGGQEEHDQAGHEKTKALSHGGGPYGPWPERVEKRRALLVVPARF